MEQFQKPSSEIESLALITEMINKARNRFSETGTLYLLWGWVIFICCITQFVAHIMEWGDLSYVWFLTWAAVIYQMYYLYKKKRTAKVKTYTDEITGFVWLVFFVCATLLVFILIKHKAYAMIDPAILVLYGMPTFLSGIILKFRPLVVGGVICWLLSIISMFVPYEYQLLLIALAVICAWIIPGYLLRKKYKNENG